MGVMTEKMKRMLSEQRLAFVATAGADGAPNLSPKGSVRALDDDHLVFADIRSPETVANLAAHPRLEVNVVDALSRTGYRFKGRAEVLREGPAFEHALQHLRREGVARPIRAVVVVQVEQALPVRSPSYDAGETEWALRSQWRAYWESLWDRREGLAQVPPPEENETSAGRGTSPVTRTPPSGEAQPTAPQRWERGDFEISTDPAQIDLDCVHQFLTHASYWAAHIPRSVVERSLRHSLLFGLYHEKRQVGFARVVTDYATFAYLADAFVLEDYRGRGLGAWLVETVVSHPDLQGLRRWLLATRDAHDLYRKAGFDLLAHPEWFMECYNPRLYEPEAEQ